jgi:predicted nucleic acid-binding protein
VADRTPAYVLDSYALLAYLAAERGGDRVREILSEAIDGKCAVHCSVINLGEVVYIVERERGMTSAQETLGLIDQLPIELRPASREAVLAAAHIKAGHALSYADAFAVAAAQELDAVILTGDPDFDSVEQIAKVERI